MVKFLYRLLFASFVLATVLVPLLFTSVNEELFEFIKMLAVYVLTITVTATYLIIRVAQKRWRWQSTPLDIVLGLFLFAQILSTVFSIHPATSFYGYYTRFHGGLLSTFAYTAIFYVLVNFLRDLSYRQARKSIQYLLASILFGAFLVGLYAIPEHFGHSASCLIVQGSFDVACWIQDVQNRVFATIGQPNWLAAYMIMVIPIAMVGLLSGQSGKRKSHSRHRGLVSLSLSGTDPASQNLNLDSPTSFAGSFPPIVIKIGWLSLIIVYYLTLIFTKSRSGWLGFVIGLIIFSGGWWWAKWQLKKHLANSNKSKKTGQDLPSTQFIGGSLIFAILIGLLTILSLIYGTPFSPPLFSKTQPASTTIVTPTGTSLESGGTESGEIRKIVWRGAFKVWQRYPLIGSGLETFAYSYYRDRPLAHNLVSEWNFLYNKAHNEFLNYLATTGLMGLLTYVLLLGWGCWLGVKLFWQRTKVLSQVSCQVDPDSSSSNSKNTQHSISLYQPNNVDFDYNAFMLSPLLPLALISSIIALSVSNFFGFSTVMVTLLMYVFLAIVSVLTIFERQFQKSTASTQLDFNNQSLSKNQRRRLEKTLAHQNLVTNDNLNSPINYFNQSDFYTRQSVTFNCWWQYALTSFICIVTITLLWNTLNWWLADAAFARGKALIKGNQWQDGLTTLISASTRSPREALYSDTLSEQYAQLALKLYEVNEATLSAEFIQAAQQASDVTLKLNPVHLNFWKTRVRLYSQLSVLNPQYLIQTKAALEAAIKLAPTDPALVFNQGKIATFEQNWLEAEKYYLKAIEMKPNLVEARIALAELYEQLSRPTDASQQYQYLLNNINPDDELLQSKVEALATMSGQRR